MADKLILDAVDGFSISKAAEEFYRNVIAAQDKMLEEEIEANVIILNGKRFSFLKKQGYIPTICGMKVEYANLPESVDFLLQYRADHVKTNADKIRAMNDEELAEYLGKLKAFGFNHADLSEEFKEQFTGWLKQEAT